MLLNKIHIEEFALRLCSVSFYGLFLKYKFDYQIIIVL